MMGPDSSSGSAASWLPPLPSLNGIGRTDFRARAAYSEGAGIYRILPAAVTVPSTTAALRELVTWAAHRRVPLVPRGAGSGMPGGNVGCGVIVDLTTLDGCPIEVHPALRRAYSGAGATLRDLSAEAERWGLRLPPDPSSARFATLGGMVATNAAGPHSVQSGSTRRWVDALDLITADGDSLTLRRGAVPRPVAAVERFVRNAEPTLRAARQTILNRFPKTRKNSSGYALDAWLASGDLLDLLIGSEGTLAFITGIEWRLVPIPARYAGVRAALRSLDILGDVVRQLDTLDPAALEYLDATFLRFVGEAGGAAGLLLVEFEGEEGEALEGRLREAASILTPHASELREATDRRGLESLWAVRHAASPILAGLGESRRSLQVIEDACVPLEAIGSYVEAVRRAGQRHGMELVIFGHAGDGNLHVNLQPDVALTGWEERVRAIFAEVSEVVIRLGGSLSGEHGDGRLRARALDSSYGSEIVGLFRLVKEAFDPVGILNPGVKLPAEGDRPFAALKVGGQAAQLPPEIEAGLREIERTAGYSVSRLELADSP
ncbi:MAG TPA: FAD-binding oxidoreductase [Gemmatimonadales bacterium]|nr:FAD-binding oxidoreductase [Gemmatimonadales bacterium]